MKKITPLLMVVAFIVGCQSTSSTKSVSPVSNTPSTYLNFKKFKLYPYKSAILKYKQKDKTIIWDDWGRKFYESRYKNQDIIMIDDGLEYRIDHRQKKITKMRHLITDWLIVANQDLRTYFVDAGTSNAVIKTGEHEKVAGQNCNIWLNSIPSPSVRYCLYDDLIVLKKEEYDSQSKKWKMVKEAYVAKFDTPIDATLFTNIPAYSVRNIDAEGSSDKVHQELRADPSGYRHALEVENKVKIRGARHKRRVRLEKVEGKKMLERYLHRTIRNGVYYP